MVKALGRVARRQDEAVGRWGQGAMKQEWWGGRAKGMFNITAKWPCARVHGAI